MYRIIVCIQLIERAILILENITENIPYGNVELVEHVFLTSPMDIIATHIFGHDMQYCSKHITFLDSLK